MDGLDWLHETRPKINKQRNINGVTFRDLNPDYSQDTEPLIIEEEKAIRARIRLVLSSLTGSEDFLPTFASSLPLRLYEPIGKITAYLLELDTIIALNNWMSDSIRIGADVVFEPLETEEGYRIDIPFVIKKTNSLTRYTFDILR